MRREENGILTRRLKYVSMIIQVRALKVNILWDLNSGDGGGCRIDATASPVRSVQGSLVRQNEKVQISFDEYMGVLKEEQTNQTLSQDYLAGCPAPLHPPRDCQEHTEQRDNHRKEFHQWLNFDYIVE